MIADDSNEDQEHMRRRWMQRRMVARRNRWLEGFSADQSIRREWVSLFSIADWCGRYRPCGVSFSSDADIFDSAFKQLLASIRKGEFGTYKKWDLLLLNPNSKFLRITRDYFNEEIMPTFGWDFTVLRDGYLRWMWVPSDAAQNWLLCKRVEIPPWMHDAAPIIPERIATMQADGWGVQTLDGRVLSMEWRDPAKEGVNERPKEDCVHGSDA